MSARWLIILGLLAIATVASAFSWNDDSHYVSLGQRNGYYIVQPDSHLFRQLGLYEAPWIDTADPLRDGYGADALAFRFNHNGILITPLAYIAQSLPYDFYMRRSRDDPRCGDNVRPRTQSRQSPRWIYVVLRVASLQSV